MDSTSNKHQGSYRIPTWPQLYTVYITVDGGGGVVFVSVTGVSDSQLVSPELHLSDHYDGTSSA